MNIEWTLQRKPTHPDWMFGKWDCAGVYQCDTLEDELREVKVDDETAIWAGRYELTFEFSPKFQRKLLTVNNVPGFSGVRVHSVRTDKDTSGCIGVGDKTDEVNGTLAGGIADHVREKLEQFWQVEHDKGNRVFLTIKNAPGDKYVDTGNLAAVA